jgi:hypothetical protein
MRLLILLLSLSLFGRAQLDSALTVPLIGINFGGHLPLADMADRFGPNLAAGGSFLLKTKHNWVIGIQGTYMYGKNVKEDVLKQLKNPDGYITDNEGYPADIRVTERAVGAHLVLGKIFSVSKKNPNSGIIFNVGVGYLQHKINIYDAQRRIAAIKGDRVYGYDRLSIGPSFTQFLGYLYLSENRLLNFYLGFEACQAFTKSLRKMNYDTGLPDTKSRLDALVGAKVGWILPLYKKKPKDYYYN